MRVRHRIPSIFNISMVDVLCCALGCVILLWLLNLREAEEHERDQTLLLEQTTTERNVVSSRLRDLQGQIVLLEEERGAIKKQMTGQVATALDLERKLKAALARIASLTGDLAESEKRGSLQRARIDDLGKKLASADTRVKDLTGVANTVPGLQIDLKAIKTKLSEENALTLALQREMTKKTQEAADLNKSLQVVMLNKKSLETNLKDKDKELVLALVYKDQLATAESRIVDMEKAMAVRAQDLAASTRTIESLQNEKKSLQSRALRLQAEADNRFAGIALTGRRVVFLVDMSGSMDRVDPETLAPNKWAEVRNTMARIMRSLQDLESFQVIVFNQKATWPLGQEGKWIEFDPKTSVDQAHKALAAIQPEGGTHMYAGLEAAFSLRDEGLDTVYLLSDGLPNNGPGLSSEDRKRLKGKEHEVELGNLLGRHILRTLKANWNKGGKVRINSIGFFYESPDVGAFLWALSRANGGSFVGMNNP